MGNLAARHFAVVGHPTVPNITAVQHVPLRLDMYLGTSSRQMRWLSSTCRLQPILYMRASGVWKLLTQPFAPTVVHHEIHLWAIYIRSADNVVADFFSRLAAPHDYRIAEARFESVQAMWGRCTVDAFASGATARLQRWWAERPTHGAEAVDAFAQEWRGERAWAHPPPFLLPQLAQLLRERPDAEALVCAPYWPGEAWYADLLELSSEHISFPAGSLQRVAADAPARLETWPVTVFRVPLRA